MSWYEHAFLFSCSCSCPLQSDNFWFKARSAIGANSLSWQDQQSSNSSQCSFGKSLKMNSSGLKCFKTCVQAEQEKEVQLVWRVLAVTRSSRAEDWQSRTTFLNCKTTTLSMRFVCGKFSTSLPQIGRSKESKSILPGTEIKSSESIDDSPVNNRLVLRFRNIFAVNSVVVACTGIKMTSWRIFGKNSREKCCSVAIWLETRLTGWPLLSGTNQSDDEFLRHVPCENSRWATAWK